MSFREKKTTVVFDEAHGQRRWGDTGFPPHTIDGLYSSLVMLCQTKLELDLSRTVDRISPQLLDNIDVFVIPSPTGKFNHLCFWDTTHDSKFTSSECQLLWNFVANGGGLLIMAHRHSDDFTKSNLNELAKPFGLEFRPRVFVNKAFARMGESWAPITTRIEQHEITLDVHVVCLSYCCPILVSNNEICQPLVWPPANTIELDLMGKTYPADKDVAIAVSYFGKGRVIAIGSDHLFSEELEAPTKDYHNLRLGENIFRFLASAPKTEEKPKFRPKVFLSHQSSDKPFARKLAHDLLKRGIDVWFDEFHLLVGDSLTESIDRAISAADFFVLIVSKASLKSKWVSKEYQSANARMLERSDFRILPVIIEDCELPAFLRDVVWADFRQDREGALERLARSIEEHFNKRSKDINI